MCILYFRPSEGHPLAGSEVGRAAAAGRELRPWNYISESNFDYYHCLTIGHIFQSGIIIAVVGALLRPWLVVNRLPKWRRTYHYSNMCLFLGNYHFYIRFVGFISRFFGRMRLYGRRVCIPTAVTIFIVMVRYFLNYSVKRESRFGEVDL